MAVCLLTNSARSASLYREVFTEVFRALVGITVPAGPCPAGGPAGDLERHAGRYELPQGPGEWRATTRGWSCQAGMVAM